MRALIALLALLVVDPLPAVAQSAAAADPASPPIIVLVRHAEKADDDPRDPSLTEEGAARASLLADMLGRSGVTAVLSTDYRRTRRTAGPLAEAAGVGVELYDPTDLAALAADLRNRSGIVVVVGHSNTTPELVAQLGGEPGEPIDEEGEYDRLYVVYPGGAGPSPTMVLRFGRPWVATPGGGG